MDIRPVRTSDGSFTLFSERSNAYYHSLHGAVQESVHVFIKSGSIPAYADLLATAHRRPLDLLEVGLGTGLNMLLTWIQCLEGKCEVNYTCLEPFPVSTDLLNELAYWDELGWPGLKTRYLEMMNSDPEVPIINGSFHFVKRSQRLEEVDDRDRFDLIYFDVFAPRSQPELWTHEIFTRMFEALRPGGTLVTYCAKGQVRRNMLAAGLQVERLPGPLGKREMLRARKP